jgi:hypothetical protein
MIFVGSQKRGRSYYRRRYEFLDEEVKQPSCHQVLRTDIFSDNHLTRKAGIEFHAIPYGLEANLNLQLAVTQGAY